jgi:hypothetical protein
MDAGEEAPRDQLGDGWEFLSVRNSILVSTSPRLFRRCLRDHFIAHSPFSVAYDTNRRTNLRAVSATSCQLSSITRA